MLLKLVFEFEEVNTPLRFVAVNNSICQLEFDPVLCSSRDFS